MCMKILDTNITNVWSRFDVIRHVQFLLNLDGIPKIVEYGNNY